MDIPCVPAVSVVALALRSTTQDEQPYSDAWRPPLFLLLLFLCFYCSGSLSQGAATSSGEYSQYWLASHAGFFCLSQIVTGHCLSCCRVTSSI